MLWFAKRWTSRSAAVEIRHESTVSTRSSASRFTEVMFTLGNRQIHRTYPRMPRRHQQDRIARPQYVTQLRVQNVENRGSRVTSKRPRKWTMLDLSVFTTEECVYPKCEGGLICAATRQCVARKARVVGSPFARPESCRTRFDVTSQLGDSGRCGVMRWCR